MRPPGAACVGDESKVTCWPAFGGDGFGENVKSAVDCRSADGDRLARRSGRGLIVSVTVSVTV